MMHLHKRRKIWQIQHQGRKSLKIMTSSIAKESTRVDITRKNSLEISKLLSDKKLKMEVGNEKKNN